MNLPQVNFADYGFSKQNKFLSKTCNQFNMKEKLFGIFKTHNIHKRKEKGAGFAA